jgi:hypothetical protein
VKDKEGKVYEVKKKEGSENAVVLSSANVSAIGKLPSYIGWAFHNEEHKGYFCNSQNIAEDAKILVALKNNVPNLWSYASSCDITVIDSISVDWYNAKLDTTGVTLDRLKFQTESFYVRLNGEKRDINKYIKVSDLKEENNTCELVVEESGSKKTKVIALFNLTTKAKASATDLRMEVEREIPGNPHRKDTYIERGGIASNNDMPLKSGSTLNFRVLNIKSPGDTIVYSNDSTQWFVNKVNIYTGSRFVHKVDPNESWIKAVMQNGDTMSVNLLPDPEIIVDGRIKLNYSAVRTNRSDTITARNYFNTALPRCKQKDVGAFINSAPHEIVVNVNRANAVDGIIHQGDASDGASIKPESYNILELANIQKDRDGAINNARIVSKLNDKDKDLVNKSILDGRANQQTEVLLLRIGRLSVANRNSLQTMINQKTENSAFMDTIRYEITKEDNISEWMTFHNNSPIGVNINIDDGRGGTIVQTEFTRLMAHELLHHWWTYFNEFDKLKWHVIRDKVNIYGYQLSDGLSTGSPADSNQGCSMGAGHERHNPEHAKVCTDQNNY